MHYIFFPFLFIWFILVTLVGWALSPLPKGKGRCFHVWYYKFWSLSFFNMFWFRHERHNHNALTLPKRYILISNHYSGVDTIWLPGKFRVVPLAKNDLNKWPIVGSILRAAGMIFIDRKEISSRTSSIDRAKKTLKNGTNLLIFPEGGCHGRYLSNFKDGAFSIAMATGIPILPAYLYYEDEDCYELKSNEGFDYLVQCLFKRKNNRVHLHVYDAISPEGFATTAEFRSHVFEMYKMIEKDIKGSSTN